VATYLQCLPLVNRRNQHRFSVFGHGTAGNLNALFGQKLGNTAVGEGLAAVFGVDQLTDKRLDGRGGTFSAAIGF
jgi:hypothetical protein